MGVGESASKISELNENQSPLTLTTRIYSPRPSFNQLWSSLWNIQARPSFNQLWSSLWNIQVNHTGWLGNRSARSASKTWFTWSLRRSLRQIINHHYHSAAYQCLAPLCWRRHHCRCGVWSSGKQCLYYRCPRGVKKEKWKLAMMDTL